MAWVSWVLADMAESLYSIVKPYHSSEEQPCETPQAEGCEISGIQKSSWNRSYFEIWPSLIQENIEKLSWND